ncbi:MAG: diaminopimelate decarboxylase [Desulfobacterales bacterium]|nr:MAG: diaminopimelate decarboxylase [Desulfobacterales bacterium]
MVETDHITEEDTALIGYDLSWLRRRIQGVMAAFPEDCLHAVAVKANPLTGVLSRIRDTGIGMEAASLPELRHALEIGYPPGRIVYDSPVKTRKEIAIALRSGVLLNANTLSELGRIADFLTRERAENPGAPLPPVGIRVNPQVGLGTIAATSVAARDSKFGVPLSDYRDEIIGAFDQYDWLCGIHLHIGSQGCPMDMLVDGTDRVYRLARDINDRAAAAGRPRPIRFFDMGGGLPAAYHRDRAEPDIREYAEKLRECCPRLFTDEFRLITEFGRHIHAGSGWAASRAEYVEPRNGGYIVCVHVGADLFLRKCYRPEDWHHDISVLHPDGRPKTGVEIRRHSIAGPLCFAGDLTARNMPLPKIDPGDWVIFHDTGAYTFGMWSRYNSRQTPKIIGYEDDGNRFFTLKNRETVEEVCAFWE